MCFIILKAESVYLTLETPHSITGVPANNFSMKDEVNMMESMNGTDATAYSSIKK